MVEAICKVHANSGMSSVVNAINKVIYREYVNPHDQSTHSPHSVESVVATVSPAESVSDIPPVFQIVDFPELSRKLKLVVDSASPITLINSKTWLDLNKQSTDHVLGAFEGQPIHPVGYFEAKVSREGEVQNVAVLQIYVSQNGINIMGCDGLTKLNITITPEMFSRVAAIEPVLPTPLQDLLNLYEDLFKPELGHSWLPDNHNSLSGAPSQSHLAFQVYLTHLQPLAIGQKAVFEAYKTWAVLPHRGKSWL